MTLVSWRNAALALAAICVYQSARGCAATTPATGHPAGADPALAACLATQSLHDSLVRAENRSGHTRELASRRYRVLGVDLPGWALRFLPQPGERLRDYRDRMLPLAELAIAPQRERVARLRDALPGLDAHQRATLDTAVQDAATAIQQRIMTGIADGELAPASFKPMTGVEVARDVLDIVDRGNTQFLSSLTPEQRTALASNRFDFADYLTFSAPWEDALKVLD